MGADNTFGEESFKPSEPNQEQVRSNDFTIFENSNPEWEKKHPTDENLYRELLDGKITIGEFIEKMPTNADQVTPIKKPPLGLKPREFHEQNVAVDRVNEIVSAIWRFYEAGSKIPIEWIEEYNELIDKTKLDK